MNITSLIKISGLAVSAAIFSSCAQQNPNAQGITQNNPYAVPGLNGQNQAQAGQYPSYPQQGGAAPYQPLPGVPSDPAPMAAPSNTPYSPATPAAPSSTGSSYEVVSGDTLWGISRKHGVSVDAIKQANGLQSDNIRAGQTLNIPGN